MSDIGRNNISDFIEVKLTGDKDIYVLINTANILSITTAPDFCRIKMADGHDINAIGSHEDFKTSLRAVSVGNG
jgi:hypothetical protein